MNWFIISIHKRERKYGYILMYCIFVGLLRFYLLLSHTIFSIEDDDEIERDLSRAGLAQRNKNCVVQ